MIQRESPAGSGLEKVAVYCRLSEEDREKKHQEDESGSIQNQKTMLLQYAEQQGWQVYRVYSDDDYTGADRNRPAFQQLIQDAQQRRFDIVLCKTQSRFTRELELVEKYLHGLFPLWGIRFVSVVDNADTANKGNKKSRQINGLINEWYLEDLSENIRSVLNSRRENGYHIGAFAPYGYRKDPERKGRLLVDPQAAAVVREVFSLFAQGTGKTAIARLLNRRGIPNPTEYKRLQGLRYQQPPAKTSTLWKYFTIGQMLRNPVYIGNLVQGRYGSVSYKTKQCKPRPKSQWYVVEGTHQPIVSRELWDQVQSLLEQRAKPFEGGVIGLFARKARCAGCGATLRSSKSSAQRGGRHYLQCPTRHVCKDACPGAFVSVDRLEAMVLEQVRWLADNFLDLPALENSLPPPPGFVEQAQWKASLAAWEQKDAQWGRALGELYLDKTRGALTQEEYQQLSQELSRRRRGVESQIAQGKERLAQLASPPPADWRQQIVRRYTQWERLSRPVVEALIDCVYVGRRVPGTRNVPIEIHWKL